MYCNMLTIHKRTSQSPIFGKLYYALNHFNHKDTETKLEDDCLCFCFWLLMSNFLVQFTMFTFHTISSTFLYMNFQLSSEKIPLKSELDLSTKSRVGFCSWMVLALYKNNENLLLFPLHQMYIIIVWNQVEMIGMYGKMLLTSLDSIIKKLL